MNENISFYRFMHKQILVVIALFIETGPDYIINDKHLYISASIGLSIMNNAQLHAAAFLKEADMAMYEAKHKGRDGVILFSKELRAIVEKKIDIEWKILVI
ncbi:MAG: hypothetical protein SPLUMA2_SPLUMAMAG2_00073 [uncultured Sulfurimonas sp.]|nr:MAG: hypothetical protein SPLUMA1_SPLUMAMAG1_00973 [uncultured Sulfurimonas sp.]CAI6151079.1 MAG: hypothetical protein SPLUMA2_SPLUMAMAG2_00073 [uncultured Sulfurimonas sp.]